MNHLAVFEELYPELVQSMKETNHGLPGKPSPYHLEGSVWKHTTMVYEAAKKHTNDNILLWTAVLHDIGKPYIYVDKNSKRYFTGHEGISFYMASDIVRSKEFIEVSGLSPQSIDLLLRVIAKHGDFLKNIIPNAIHELDKELLLKLIKFNKYDRLGSIAAPWVETKEQNVNDYSFYESADSNKNIRVDFLIGPPGIGKSTFREEIKKENSVVISYDDFVLKNGIGNTYTEKWESLKKVGYSKFLNEARKTIKEEFAKPQAHIIIDKTNMSIKSRKHFMRMIPKNKAYINAYVILTNGYEKTLKVNLQRVNNGDKIISKEVLKRMMKNLQYPLHTEGFNMVSNVL